VPFREMAFEIMRIVCLLFEDIIDWLETVMKFVFDEIHNDCKY
jgi:hypothetical protein